MMIPPDLDTEKLDAVTLNSPADPSFLGYTPTSWLRLIEQEGPVFRTTYRGGEAYVIGTREADLSMWKSPENWVYGPPSSGGDFFREVLGEMHVTQLDGEAHRRSRKLILPAFGVSAVTRDIAAVDRVVADRLRQLSARTVDFHPDLSRIIAHALNVSQIKEALDDDLVEQLVFFEEAFIPASGLTNERRQQWYERPAYRSARQAAFTYFERIVDERLSGTKRGDSLDLVIERAVPEGLAPLSKEELVRATYLLCVAGVGNIANIVCAALWALQGSEWLDHLREELAGFNVDDLKSGVAKYPILRAVISETERCFLPAPVIPKMSARPLNFMDFEIPGEVHILHLHGLAHFEEQRYANADKFDPSRWLSEAKAERANAFGGGPHLCLGMGVTRLYVPLLLAHLVRDYDWQLSGPPVYVSQAEDFEDAPLTTRCTGELRPSKIAPGN